MEVQLKPVDLVRQSAKGAMPVLLFFLFLGIASVAEEFALIPVFLAIASIGLLTPSRIIWAESLWSAMIAATLVTALMCAGVAYHSWLAVPAVWMVMAPAAIAQIVFRLYDDSEARVVDCVIAFILGLAGFALAATLAFTAGTTVSGLATIGLVALLVAFRRRVGPPALRD